jgi:hypothetical protein
VECGVNRRLLKSIRIVAVGVNGVALLPELNPELQSRLHPNLGSFTEATS